MAARHASVNYKRLLPFVKQAENAPDWFRRFTAPGYMPLTVEYSGTTDVFGDDVFYISHTLTQNGDIMRDPEMMFSVNHETKTVRPLIYRNDLGFGVEQEVFLSQTLYRPRLLTELDDFLWRWLRNIKEQGFDPDIYES